MNQFLFLSPPVSEVIIDLVTRTRWPVGHTDLCWTHRPAVPHPAHRGSAAQGNGQLPLQFHMILQQWGQWYSFIRSQKGKGNCVRFLTLVSDGRRWRGWGDRCPRCRDGTLANRFVNDTPPLHLVLHVFCMERGDAEVKINYCPSQKQLLFMKGKRASWHIFLLF